MKNLPGKYTSIGAYNLAAKINVLQHHLEEVGTRLKVEVGRAGTCINFPAIWHCQNSRGNIGSTPQYILLQCYLCLFVATGNAGRVVNSGPKVKQHP